jgi:hypothetical protein
MLIAPRCRESNRAPHGTHIVDDVGIATGNVRADGPLLCRWSVII